MRAFLSDPDTLISAGLAVVASLTLLWVPAIVGFVVVPWFNGGL